jgi:hypothetical protein
MTASHESTERDLDIYHHFPESVERLLEALVGILTSPIQIEVNSNGERVHMVLTPQTAREN